VVIGTPWKKKFRSTIQPEDKRNPNINAYSGNCKELALAYGSSVLLATICKLRLRRRSNKMRSQLCGGNTIGRIKVIKEN
jgi:hypothetical protein